MLIISAFYLGNFQQRLLTINISLPGSTYFGLCLCLCASENQHLVRVLSIRPNIPKFSKREQMVQKFPGKCPENAGIVEFPKRERFNRKFQEKIFENLGVPRKVVLFFKYYANPQFSIQC